MARKKPKTPRPEVDDAPGLAWRPRPDGWLATWVARPDIVKKGFRPKTQRLTLVAGVPTLEERLYIQSECERLQRQMLSFGRGKSLAPGAFKGTVQALIDAYQSDPDSPYHELRAVSRRNYDNNLKMLGTDCGTRMLHALTARDFRRWYKAWRYPDGPDGPDRPYTAHGGISMMRMILSFGIAFEVENVLPGQVSQCARLKTILSEMEFENGGARKEQLTYQQAVAIIAEANRRGEHSIALVQAGMSDLGAHQKDFLGEWVKMSEPGLSDVTYHGEKWLYGIRWEEITVDLLLDHKMAKSRKGKVLEFDLKHYPLLMAELARIPPERRQGPLVICEKTGLPWAPMTFRQHWRDIARAVGVPDNVQNMDTRAGVITETVDALNGNLEAARKQAGHTSLKTTGRYSRGDRDSNSKTAIARVERRRTND